MIRYLEEQEKYRSRNLWEEAFPEDSESFDDYYFEEKLKDNRILVLEDWDEQVTVNAVGAGSQEADEASGAKRRGTDRAAEASGAKLQGAGRAEASGAKHQGVGRAEVSGANRQGTDRAAEAAVGSEERRIDSMIHLNPYLVQVRDRRWRVDYLVGVATRKDRRHRGYMRRLLVHMMADMRDEQMPFCFLMPADEAIYRPFGFTYIFRQPNLRLRENAVLERRSLMAGRDGGGARRWLSGIAEWMNRWLKERYQVFAVRDEAYLKRLLDELASENGSLDVLYDGEAMAGFHSEWGLKEREQRLLYCREAYTEPAAEAKPAIMARIISPEVFARAIRLSDDAVEDERVILLQLDDPLIPANQGVWEWHLSHEMSWMEKRDGAEAEISLRIEELTGWLFGYEVPEAAKPYEQLVDVLDGVFLDEVV